MKTLMGKPERLLELGGTKKDIALLAIGGIALVCSLLKWQPFPLTCSVGGHCAVRCSHHSGGLYRPCHGL